MDNIFGNPQEWLKDMEKQQKEFEKMDEQLAILRFKNKKKEPLLRRKAILEEMYHKGFIEALWEDHEEFINSDATVNVEEFDKYIEKRLEEFDKYITNPINEYYDKKLKEIDDMKLKVVRKES